MQINRFATPIVLIIVSIGLFFGFVNKGFKEKVQLEEQVSVYKDAIEKAKQLKAKQEELDGKRLSIGSVNLKNLEKLLPDNVDTVRTIMDLNGIAEDNGILLKSIKISDSKAEESSKVTAGGPTTDVVKKLDYESESISFDVNTTYEKFVSFLLDLEESLRILDVTNITLKLPKEGTGYDFSVTAVTYWLK